MNVIKQWIFTSIFIASVFEGVLCMQSSSKSSTKSTTFQVECSYYKNKNSSLKNKNCILKKTNDKNSPQEYNFLMPKLDNKFMSSLVLLNLEGEKKHQKISQTKLGNELSQKLKDKEEDPSINDGDEIKITVK